MPIRGAIRGGLLLATTVLLGSGTAEAWQACTGNGGLTYHGELTKPLKDYSYDELWRFASRREWDSTAGVRSAPRRADCGGACVNMPGRQRRDDSPRDTVFVSNDPICDARAIEIRKLPKHGVLIGRLTYERTRPGSAKGDASFSVTGRGDRRERQHFVLLQPGEKLVDKDTYAMWRIIAFHPRGSTPEFAVADSGLFRACLPMHAVTVAPLASFRSCAEIADFHALSQDTVVQRAVFGNDTANAQPRLFRMLVLADTTAINRLRVIPDSVLFRRRPDDDASASGEVEATHGPFAAAVGMPRPERSIYARYGELRIDSPMWYVCASGCCSGEPW
jgi:hypothetical protein